MERHSRKDHWECACQQHAALYRLNQIGNVPVAGVVIAVSVGDADDGSVKCVIRIPHGLYEGASKKKRELRIAIAGQPLAQPLAHPVNPFMKPIVNGCSEHGKHFKS